MAESRKREGIFGSYTEHTDDQGNKIGESRDRDGILGAYIEHVDQDGQRSGESRQREGVFGTYAEHVDVQGNKTGESREREGIFGAYTEHVDKHGNKIGESREREGLFGEYTEHTVRGHVEDKDEADSSFDLGPWIVKGVALLFAIALVFASWPLWLGMLLITTVLSTLLSWSLANGGWAVNVNERVGGRVHMLAPGVAILIAVIIVSAAGLGGIGTANVILLSFVLIGSGIACWHVSTWVFGFVMRRAVRRT